MVTDAGDTPTTFFPGFDIPRQNWFKMPNNWTDITAEISSLAELKVVEYVLKHTWGYQEYGSRKRITNDEFMHGRRRKDGTRIDKGTGLSKPSVIAGLKAAVEQGLLIEEVDDADKARVKKYYCLRMMPGLQDEAEVIDQPPNRPDDEETGGGVKDLYPGVKDLNAGVKDLYSEVKFLYPRGKETLPRTEKETLERNSKQDKENNNNNIGSHPPPDVVVVLTQYGISTRVANRLVNQYDRQQITEKVEFLNYLMEVAPEKVKTPQGWLRRAIEEDYAAPDGYQSPVARSAEALAAQRHEEEMQGMVEKQRQREEEMRQRRRQEKAVWLAQLQKEYGTSERELTLWRQILEEFRLSLPTGTFQLYMANTVLLSVSEGEALVGLPNRLTRDWVENRLTNKIQRILSAYLQGQKVTVKFIDLVLPAAPLDGAEDQL